MKALVESETNPEVWETYQKAVAGDADAQNAMGVAYRDGKGVEQSYEEAARWFRSASDLGSVEATYNLGCAYLKGRGVEEDPTYASLFMHRAAVGGYAPAEMQYGKMLCTGNGVDADMDRGREFLKRACSKGDAEAAYGLYRTCSNYEVSPYDDETKVRVLTISAERGNADAMLDLGAAYCNGTIVETDFKKAHMYTSRAAKLGNRTAQYNMGLHYLYGRGVKKDLHKALLWFRRSARNGYDSAVKELVELYSGREGVERDEDELAKWSAVLDKVKPKPVPESYRMSDTVLDEPSLADFRFIYDNAVRGNPMAQFDLSMALREGEGVPCNVPLADQWLALAARNGYAEAQYRYAINCAKDDLERHGYLMKAAKQGCAGAMCELGYAYYYGKVVRKNLVKARSWMEKAAEAGFNEAWLAAGYMNLEGIGGDVDLDKGCYWYEKSAEAGDDRAQCKLGKLYTAMDDPVKVASGMQWLRASAAQGNSPATAALIKQCFNEDSPYYDVTEGFRWATKLAETGDAEGLFYKGVCYLHGKGAPQDDLIALEALEKAAILEYLPAFVELDWHYAYDADRAYNYDKAQEMIYRLDAYDDNLGRLNTALEHYTGVVIRQSYPKAAKLLAQCAEEGSEYGRSILGMLYLLGKGVKRSCRKAEGLLRPSADSGDISAELILAGMAADGLTSGRDPGEELQYLLRAAEGGSIEAVDLLLRRDDLPSDLHERDEPTPYLRALHALLSGSNGFAVKVLEPAAKRGCSSCTSLLGLMHYRGLVEGASEQIAYDLFCHGDNSAAVYAALMEYRGQGTAKDVRKAEVRALSAVKCDLSLLAMAVLAASYGEDGSAESDRKAERWGNEADRLIPAKWRQHIDQIIRE